MHLGQQLESGRQYYTFHEGFCVANKLQSGGPPKLLQPVQVPMSQLL